MILAETYIELLTDLDHWMFDLTVEVVTSVLIGIPIGRAYQKWHDRRHHSPGSERIVLK